MSRHCSFCDMPEEVIKKLIMHGGNNVGICDRCIELCNLILREPQDQGNAEYDSWSVASISSPSTEER